MTAVEAPPVAPVDPGPPPGAPPRAGWSVGRLLGLAAAVVVLLAVVLVADAAGVAPGWAVFAGLLLVPIAHDVVARPMFRRLAVRNASRRPGEAALVIIGSLLGTAIITASFVVGDTVTASLRDEARLRLGPLDEAVEVTDLDELRDVEAAIVDDPPVGIDGTVPLVAAPGAAANDDRDRPRAAPSVALLEVDFDAARAFGPDEHITGLADAGATPGQDEAVINERLADELEVEPGDTIRVFAYGYALLMTVRDVVPELGLAGYTTSSDSGFDSAGTTPIFVAPGTVEQVAGASIVPTASPPVGQLLVSNEGGVFDSDRHGDEIAHGLEARVEDIEGAEVRTLKTDLLGSAREDGADLQELFGGIGTFSVIAGVLLLVNLFVMLADERKSQLGMQRALGFRRNHLCRTFAIEGASYAVIASVLGAIAGIGVGWVINQIASQIVADDSGGLAFRLDVETSSLVAGGLTGFVISLLTVWATSIRTARFNVIAAIRDLPQPRRARQGILGALLGVAGLVLGALCFAAGYADDDPVLVMLGVPIALFSLIPVLARRGARKPVVIGISVAVLAWTVAVFSLFPDAMEGSDIPVFVLMGVLLVAAAVAIASQMDHVWIALNDRMSGFGGGLSARLGLAYPLARKFRTGMLLGMYAIVIFTMTFMSAFLGIFGSQAPAFTRDIAAGYDIFLESSPGNPVTLDDLHAQPEVAAAAPLLYGFPEFAAGEEQDRFPLTGFDDSLLVDGGIALDKRSTDYATDEAAFRAVLADPSLVIVDDYFLQDGSGPPDSLVSLGDTITVTNPATHERRGLHVVGVVGSDFVFHGALAGWPFVDEFLGDQAAEFRHYVRVAPGADPDEVADTLKGRLVANGADASSFRQLVDDQIAQQEGFFSLMRGYLALGLLIGIAGLGVVMVRAVRERRREIGMLRAMGFGAKVVRRAFLVEAGFIAIQGSIMGISLGMITAYEVVVNSSTFGDQQLPFEVPWLSLAVILAVPFVASLVAAAVPATQAARIKPAVALRIAD